MKQKLLLAIGLFTSTLLSSQSTPRAFEDWRTTDGTQNFFYRNVTKTDGSGNVYVAGATLASNGTTDLLVTKKNSSGTTLWTQQYNGAGNDHDFAAGLFIDGSGNVYITGSATTNTMTMIPEMILIKYNSSGTKQWETSYAGIGYGSIGKTINIDPSGDVYVVGAVYNASVNTDYLITKHNPSTGSQTWATTYDHTSNLDDAAVDIGFFFSTAIISGAVTNSPNNYSFNALVMSRSTGSITATNTSTAVSTTSIEVVSDFKTDASGNIYVAGTANVTGQAKDFFVIKMTNTLSISWERTFNGSDNLDDVAKSLQVDASGNVYVTGYTTSSTQGKNWVTRKYNSSGTLQWSEVINSASNDDDEAFAMEMDNSANIYVTGYITKDGMNTDYHTVKYNSSGTKIWEKTTDGFSFKDKATNIALDGQDIVISGTSELDQNEFVYLTTKYVQMDVKDPVDLNGEPSNRNIGFHTNRGQVRNENGVSTTAAKYYTHHQNPEIFIENGVYNYVYLRTDTIVATNDSMERISVTFSLSTDGKKPYGYNEKGAPLHYILGDVGRPITNIRGYDRVITKDLYPDIDLHYYSNANGLKYYFVVNPGGDPRDIKLKVDGASTTTITSNNLLIDGVLGDITLKRPYAYMVNGAGATTTLSAASWASLGTDLYGITAPSYTNTQTLIIVIENLPPASITSTQANLDYSTYYGGNASDYFKDIKVTPAGDRVVAGQTSSSTFPTVKAYQTFLWPTGSIDAVVLKYTADDTLRFSTFYGASGADMANAVSINSAGYVYFAGQTQSSDLSITNNAGETNQAYNGNNVSIGTNKTDGFIIKLLPNGSNRTYGRYVGGQRSEWINSLYIDANDNVYFTGTTSSDDFPAVNAYYNSHGTTSADDFDIIAGKMNSSQVAQWITYFGGNGNGVPATATLEYGHDILTDNSGNVFVVGESDETVSFPATNPSGGNPNVLYDASNNGYADGVIIKFSSGGTPSYATFVGGNLSDRIKRAVYNPTTGDLYFAGNTGSSTGMPLKYKAGAYYDGSKHAGTAAFVGYINSSLEHQWVTYYGHGGTGKTFAVGGLSRDDQGLVYMSGTVYSDTLVYGPSTPSGAYSDNTWTQYDGFISVFDASQDIYHAHYFGGSANDFIDASDINGNYYLYVVGNTASNNFPIAYNLANATLIDSTYNGSNDGFISRFSLYPYNLVSVKENAVFGNNVVAFPNPTNNFVTLKINTELKDKVTLKVYNTVGQEIHEETIIGNEHTIDCNKWSSGMYIFVLSNKEFNSSFKIIRE